MASSWERIELMILISLPLFLLGWILSYPGAFVERAWPSKELWDWYIGKESNEIAQNLNLIQLTDGEAHREVRARYWMDSKWYSVDRAYRRVGSDKKDLSRFVMYGHLKKKDTDEK